MSKSVVSHAMKVSSQSPSPVLSTSQSPTQGSMTPGSGSSTPQMGGIVAPQSQIIDQSKMSDRDRQKLREQERRRREAVNICLLFYFSPGSSLPPP